MSIFSLKQNSSIISNLDSRYSPILHKHSELAPVIIPTFTRSSVAYKLDGTQVAAGKPRFETIDGRTGVLIEEGTTNLLANPSFESDFTGWTNSPNISGSEWVIATDSKWHGSKAAKLVGNGSHTWKGKCQIINNPTAGTKYTLSAWVRCSPGVTYGAYVRIRKSTDGGNTWNVAAESEEAKGANWTRIFCTYTVESGVNAVLFEFYSSTGNASGQAVWVDACQVEAKEYPTSWTDSSRTAESLSIPITGLSPNQGTLSFWMYVTDVTKRQIAGRYNHLFTIRGKLGYWGIIAWHSPNSPDWVLEYRDDSGGFSGKIQVPDSYTPNGWNFFTVTWKKGEFIRFYINGVKCGEDTENANMLPSAFESVMYLGSSHSGGNHLNTVFSLVHLSSKVRSDAEITAAYKLGKYLPWDEYTISLFTFDGYLDTGPRAGSLSILHEGTNQTVIPKKAVILDTNTRTVTLSYDSNGRLTSVTEKDGSTTVKTTSLSYDANGNLTQVQESAGNIVVTTQFSYNTNGQLVSISRSVT